MLNQLTQLKHDLTNRLVDRATAYEMEVSTEKSKIMTNSMNNISADISINGQKLEEVTRPKYLGAIQCKDGTCSAEVRTRIASAIAAMARLNRIWRYNTISFSSKFRLYRSLVTSIYGCENGPFLLTLKKKRKKKKTQAFEIKCLRKLLHIFLEHKTNDWVRSKTNFLVGPQEPLLATAKRRKLTRFGLIKRHDSLSKTIL